MESDTGDTAGTMSEENVELVRRAHQALDRRDLTSWLAVLDEDFEVVPTSDWPEPGVRGAEAAFNWPLTYLAVRGIGRFRQLWAEPMDTREYRGWLNSPSLFPEWDERAT
jgi:hypothetical protein